MKRTGRFGQDSAAQGPRKIGNSNSVAAISAVNSHLAVVRDSIVSSTRRAPFIGDGRLGPSANPVAS
jgi:hypothetical protein